MGFRDTYSAGQPRSRSRDTIQYPEEMTYLPPRYRGRIIMSRDPEGNELCVV